MGESAGRSNSEPLLTGGLIRLVRIDTLTHSFPWQISPIYLYTAIVVFLDFGVINTYNHVFTARTHAVISNPYSMAIPLVTITAAIGIQYMASQYQDALQQMRLKERVEGTRDISSTEFTLPLRPRLGLYVAILAGYYSYILAIIGLPTYLDILGPVALVTLGVIVYPLGYLPIAVEFLSLFVSVHFVLPKRVAAVRPKPSFLDPRNLGGFYPLGELFKRSYYIYVVCLLLYLCYIYGPVIAPFGIESVPRVGSIEAAYFTGLWVFGLAAIGHSVLTIHRIMRREKQAYLQQLEKQLYETVENPFDISSTNLYENTDIQNLQHQLNEVRAMSEYPTTTATSTQIVVSVLVPQATQLGIQLLI